MLERSAQLTAQAVVVVTQADSKAAAATTLRRMQTGGELRRDADPDELATGLIAALQGSYVLAQASRNVDRTAPTTTRSARAPRRRFEEDRVRTAHHTPLT